MTLTRFAHSIMLAWGWRRMAIALAAGAATTLALPPWDSWTVPLIHFPILWLVPFITFPILVWLIDGSAGGRLGSVVSAAAVGWWFGFGYFTAGLYWIGNAFLVDAKMFAWLIPFAVIGLPAVLALFTAIGTALARALWAHGALRVLALAVSMTAVEWLRGHVLTGFPWNAYGYALVTPLVLAQTASLLGLWGLTFLAVAIFASPAALADDKADASRRWLAPALSAVVLVAMTAFGAWRLHATPTEFVDGVRLRIMQPNLPQDEKFNYSARQQVMNRYVALSAKANGPGGESLQGTTHLIWPESAFPFFLTREAEALAQIADLLPEKTVLITGAVRAPEPTGRGPIRRAYNSVYVIDHDGSILSVYDKMHLVPFGEYLPLQDFLERRGLMQLTKVQGGYIVGDRRRRLTVPNAPPVLPLVCYEVIFPGEVVGNGERPGWLVNVTNDAWYGKSPGPYQHFQQARVRAIEEGLPLVRAANNGISAVVDPLGRVVGSLPLATEGVLDARLPRALAPTPYARVGDTTASLIVAAAFVLVMRRRRKAK